MRFLTILFLLFSTACFSQKRYYTSSDYGWQYKRIKADTTLSFPTGCGNPVSVYSVVTNQAALYFDSCNKRLWVYNPKVLVWDSVHVGKLPPTTNIYNADGTLTGNRQLNGTGLYSLELGGLTDFIAAGTGQVSVSGNSAYLEGSSSSLILGNNNAMSMDAARFTLEKGSNNSILEFNDRNDTYLGAGDSMNFNSQAGKYYFNNLPIGPGNKSVRYNTTTKQFTYADTTSGGGSTAGIDDVLAVNQNLSANRGIELNGNYLSISDENIPVGLRFTNNGYTQLGDWNAVANGSIFSVNGNNSNAALFDANGTQKLKINSISNADSTLDVEGSIKATGGVRFTGIPQTSLDTTSNKIAVFATDGTLKKSFWQGGGSGLIYTNTPNKYLNDYGSFATLHADSIANGTTNKFTQWTTSGANIGFSGGSVGIGTTNPISTLQVNGSVRLADTLLLNDGGYGPSYLSRLYKSGAATTILEGVYLELRSNHPGGSVTQNTLGGFTYFNNLGQFSIGSYTPTASSKLHVEGNAQVVNKLGVGGAFVPDSSLHIVGGFKYDHLTKGAGKILQSDANGGATWWTPNYITTETDPAVASINGLVKSNGTTISTAVAGTDYLTPTGNGSGLTGLTGSQITGNISGNAANVTGTVAVGNGGTGATTLTGIMVGNGTSTVTAVAGTAGQFLRRNAGNTAYEFATLAGGGDALTSNPLSQFAATTSAQLAGVISDESGTGNLVLNTAPTITSPNLAGEIDLTGITSPSQYTTDQTDASYTGSTIVRVSTNSDGRIINSIAGGTDGRMIKIINTGGSDLILQSDDGSTGTAANRFNFNNIDVIIEPKESREFIYDATLSRWLKTTYEYNLTNMRRQPMYNWDYMVAGVSTANFPTTAVASGTATYINTEAAHPGYMTTTSSTTTNSGHHSYYLGTQTNLFFQGGETYECIYQPKVTSNTNTTTRFGFLDATSSTDAVDGAYFEIPAGSFNVVGKTANNSTRTTSATIATLSVNTWYRFVIRVNRAASSISFTIYDANGVSLGTQSITTNIPTTSARAFGAGYISTNVGTTATLLGWLDYQAFQLGAGKAILR